MRTTHWFKLALVAPALATLALVGCGDKGGGGGGNTGGPATGGATKPPAGDATPVAGKGVATVKGKIVYDGEAPKPDDLSEQISKQDDNKHCLKDDPKNPDPKHARNWIV